MKIKKAIIPCAGFGTRFLPITKTIQKEMLPILGRPIIDHVVDDCIAAGIEEIIFVINEHNYQVLHFYRENRRLYEYLERMHKIQLYDQISNIHSKAKFHFVKQTDHDPYGTAVPVILAKDFVKDEEAFLVLMGDDFIYKAGQSSEVKRMIETFEVSQANALITCIEKDDSELSRYGIAQVNQNNGYRYLEKLVEKPAPGSAPSNLANISKFILSNKIFPILEKQAVNQATGELYITDTVEQLAQSEKVVVHTPDGQYLDGGYPLGWLLSNLTVAKDDPEVWSAIKTFVNNN